MSTKYPGGFITKNYVAPTPSSASGIWTLDQQQQAQQAGIWPFGGPFTFIEDVFSTYLYTGNGATGQTITNGIDLSGKGGLTWIKVREANGGEEDHRLYDTLRGAGNSLVSNRDVSTQNQGNSLTAFNNNGFTLGGGYLGTNGNGYKYVSWTFREQPKFFDVVTYTGDGTNGRAISHSLGSVPGCIMVKRTNGTSNWVVYHRSLSVPTNKALFLNTTAAESTSPYFPTTPTSTVFYTNGDGYEVNTTGQTYVAYLFAHNAGGFGATGTDNVISCGSFTADGSGAATVTLGYEPQWILCKPTSSTGDWFIADNMRGFSLTSTATLYPNSSGAENSLITFSEAYPFNPTATGFTSPNALLPSRTYIYIAIRRGPMKVPTTGTSVFSPNSQTASTGTAITINFPPDLQLYRSTSQVANEGVVVDRLRGVNTTTTANSTPWLDTTTTAAEATASSVTRNWGNTGFEMPGFVATVPSIFWSFRRAPSFFDEVCYTGTGSSQNVSHNLAAVPELLIIKRRNSTGNWEAAVPSTTAGSFFVGTSGAPISLNTTNGNGGQSAYAWASNTGTTTYFNPSGVFWNGNASGGTYVAYLFATCAGVSKVGTYTGTGAAQTINCGFTAGSRFVLIKRTDSTGDWYVWDSARGIIPSNDPYLLLNSTAAQVTGTDYVDTTNVGFDITSTAPAAINANGGTFIFLAIA